MDYPAAELNPERQISYDLALERDMADAAAIYLQNFNIRTQQWFSQEKHARCFYADLFEIIRLLHPRSFFVSRNQGRLIGCLALTIPDVSVTRLVLHPRVILKLVIHFISGRYGFSSKFLKKVAVEMAGKHKPIGNDQLNQEPHIYLLAIHREFTGLGIGTQLVAMARRWAEGSYTKMWLLVDQDNIPAIRFYERMGFIIQSSDNSQNVMVLGLAGQE